MALLNATTADPPPSGHRVRVHRSPINESGSPVRIPERRKNSGQETGRVGIINQLFDSRSAGNTQWNN
jgi:hypothetical protein